MTLEKKKIKTVAEQFHISQLCAKKYIYMSQKELEKLDAPQNYKKRETSMNGWLNVIYKMMLDGHTNETIYFYIVLFCSDRSAKLSLICIYSRAMAFLGHLFSSSSVKVLFPMCPLYHRTA